MTFRSTFRVKPILTNGCSFRGNKSGATQSSPLKSGSRSKYDIALHPHVISAVLEALVSILLAHIGHLAFVRQVTRCRLNQFRGICLHTILLCFAKTDKARAPAMGVISHKGTSFEPLHTHFLFNQRLVERTRRGVKFKPLHACCIRYRQVHFLFNQKYIDLPREAEILQAAPRSQTPRCGVFS